MKPADKLREKNYGALPFSKMVAARNEAADLLDECESVMTAFRRGGGVPTKRLDDLLARLRGEA